jgi:glycosyltransferase involved in cell wall biosynthesis
MATVGVIIPAHNEEDTISEVVYVARSVSQEIWVISDGSVDRTAEEAKRAGARVIELPENVGKGAAIEIGLRQLNTEVVLLLDADLLGLTEEHLRSLISPVSSGELDMTIGVFRDGGFMTDFGNRVIRNLSGQRACRRSWLLQVPGLSAERWPEPAITDHLRGSLARWSYVELPNLTQVMKEEKRGFWRGIQHRSRMYLDLLGYRRRTRSPLSKY